MAGESASRSDDVRRLIVSFKNKLHAAVAYDVSDYPHQTKLSRLWAEADAAQAALTDAVSELQRNDAERLNWLQQGDTRFYNIDRITSIVGRGFKADDSSDWHSGIRQAIDASMSNERNER